ncbi:RHS repeat-associated core domain-containing protein [Patescibacteria group bacterium]|nr:RHS repeat-associated core domain-containing protein [Patescibacteria group bacterium]
MRKALILSIVLLFFTTNTVLAFNPSYRFTDQEKDFESGLYNFDARQYSPNTGQFIQPDPVLNNLTDPQKLKQQTGQDLEQFLMDPQNLNPYSYTKNNPVNYVDPTGEFAAPIVTDVTTDIFFFNESLTDYQKNSSWGNAAALAADTIGLLPILPAGTGGLFKRFVKSTANLIGMYKMNRIIKAFKVSWNEINSIIKSAENAYESAQGGLKHTKFLKDYSLKSDNELQKAIKSLEENVRSHIEKLQNPFRGAENFADFSKEYQKGLIEHWKNDLLRNQEQLNIIGDIFKSRS